MRHTSISPHQRWALRCLLFALCACFAQLSFAGTAARIQDVPATTMAVRTETLPANVGFTFETVDLQPATADTVIHVQSSPAGSFIAGSDDVDGSLRSRVTLAAAPTTRTVTVVVRAFAPESAGSCVLRISRSDGVMANVPIDFGGARVIPTGGHLAGQAHVFTVEQAGGASQTAVLVVSGLASNGLAFDTEDGVGRMSWLHLDQECNNCRLFVGSLSTPSPSSALPTTLIWDEDIHFKNCDADGMGDALDIAVGADPCNDDTDNDGLSDGLETIGGPGSSAALDLKLPMWGASPTKPDLFLELDWVDCDPATTTEPCSGGRDSWRLAPAEALSVAKFFAPDVSVHLDTGVPNSDPATRTIFNDWLGASRIPEGTAPCEKLTPARVGIFHHGILKTKLGGGGSLVSPQDLRTAFVFTPARTAASSRTRRGTAPA